MFSTIIVFDYLMKFPSIFLAVRNKRIDTILDTGHKIM